MEEWLSELNDLLRIFEPILNDNNREIFIPKCIKPIKYALESQLDEEEDNLNFSMFPDIFNIELKYCEKYGSNRIKKVVEYLNRIGGISVDHIQQMINHGFDFNLINIWDMPIEAIELLLQNGLNPNKIVFDKIQQNEDFDTFDHGLIYFDSQMLMHSYDSHFRMVIPLLEEYKLDWNYPILYNGSEMSLIDAMLHKVDTIKSFNERRHNLPSSERKQLLNYLIDIKERLNDPFVQQYLNQEQNISDDLINIIKKYRY